MIPNGLFTLINTAGEHRTFAIKTQAKDANFAPGKRVVALLTGPENESNYTGFAFIGDDGAIHVWKSKRGGNFEFYATLLARAEKALEAVMDKAEGEAQFCNLGRTYTVKMSKRCLICNRTLTTPESIRLGIGPICAAGGQDEDAA